MSKLFEEIWQTAESLSNLNSSEKQFIIHDINRKLEEYSALEQIPSKDIQGILKSKKFGEILFRLAELSKLDNVNIYPALQMEVQIAERLSQASTVVPALLDVQASSDQTVASQI